MLPVIKAARTARRDTNEHLMGRETNASKTLTGLHTVKNAIHACSQLGAPQKSQHGENFCLRGFRAPPG